MKKNYYIKPLSISVIVAVILLSMAFISINSSFALSTSKDNTNFKIDMIDVKSAGIGLDNINVMGENITFNTDLSYSNPSNSINFNIVNSGNIDLKIKNIETLYYNDNLLFNYNDVDYYLSDFTKLTIDYDKTTKDNNVYESENLKNDDLLLKDTFNSVKVTICLKKNSELTEQTIDALNHYLNEHNINKSISLIINYQEK